MKYKNKNAESPTLAEYNRELDEAEKEIESGNYYTREEAQKIASQWGRNLVSKSFGSIGVHTF
ncbi:MAG TPA: hypothetical protein VFD29_08880 [Gillisia sp.]|nr:hypothetical protein [Gillisia sp.]